MMSIPKLDLRLLKVHEFKLSIDAMPSKLLPISIEHGEKDPHIIRQYESGFKNSVVKMRALKMKKVKD